MKFEIGLNFLKIPPEHFHALLVHFPVALWTVAFGFFLLSFWSRLRFLELVACLMGLVGSAFGFLALKSGEKAAEILGPDLCDLSLLESHEENAETTLIFLSGAFLILAAMLLVKKYILKKALPVFLSLIPAVGMLLGCIYLFKAGHEGYSLVYLQGVGVTKTPTPCK